MDVASEFRYREPILDENTLVIIISQSGETADTLAALRMAKAKGCRILSIVNVVGSTIANESDDVLYTWAGPEIAVASTKAYSTQLAVIYMIVLYMADQLGSVSPGRDGPVHGRPAAPAGSGGGVPAGQGDHPILCLSVLQCPRHVLYRPQRGLRRQLGGQPEAQGDQLHSLRGPTAGELKHGPISLIEDGTLVIAIATYEKLFDKMMSNVREVKARGAVVLGITVQDKEEALKQETDFQFCVPKITDFMLPSLSILPLQLFAYYVASMKGCDIDKPPQPGQVCHRGIREI